MEQEQSRRRLWQYVPGRYVSLELRLNERDGASKEAAEAPTEPGVCPWGSFSHSVLLAVTMENVSRRNDDTRRRGDDEAIDDLESCKKPEAVETTRCFPCWLACTLTYPTSR
jgi:hypothetical protein